MTTENKKAFDFGYQEVTEKEKKLALFLIPLPTNTI
jgi:hypothetical protein